MQSLITKHEKDNTMKNLYKRIIPIIAATTLITACSLDTTFSSKSTDSTSSLVTPTSNPNNDASANASASVDSTKEKESQASSTVASTQESIATTYDESLPTIVFLGDDQFDLGRSDNTSISYYVDTLLETDANVINLGCTGVNSSTAPNTTDDSSVNFVNMARYINGELDDSFWDNYPSAKAEATCFTPSDVDFYVIEFGVNDFLNIKELVNNTEIGDSSCYVNSIRVGVSLLQEASPDAKIIVCSPVYSIFFGEDGSVLGSGHVYANTFGRYLDYCSGCINAAVEKGCLPFDAFDNEYMNIGDETTGEYLQADGIHLTRAGRNTFAAIVAHMINKQLGLDDSEIGSPYDIEDYMLPGESY